MSNLLPSVKSSQSLPGQFNVADVCVIRQSGLNPTSLALLHRRFPGLEIQTDSAGFCLELQVSAACPHAPAKVPEHPDAYTMQICEDGLRVDASSFSGLFYGLQTFLQLPSVVPCQIISDYASIKLRLLHWDLKGYQPTLATFKQELYRLASYKINGILLELEDKFDFRCAPEVGVPGAYSFDDLRHISKLAKDLNITIIPKLQCLAHVDYILRHKRYAGLREDQHAFQYCPSCPDAQRLWEAMADELMECFAEHPDYFHIGADETNLLGVCPDCAKLGKMGAYMKKVNACLDYLTARGRKPIMWEDILRNLHGNMSDQEAFACRKLADKAILMYWAYGYGGQNNTFHFLHEYLNAGATVWGASGFGGCDNWAGSIAPLSIRAQNLDAWTKTAVENNLDAVVATGWTKIASADCPTEPQESTWFTSLYAAYSMWSGIPMNLHDFILKLATQLFGESLDEPLEKAVMNIADAPYDYDDLAPRDTSCKQLQFLRYAAAAESMTTVRDQLVNYLQYYHGQLGRLMPDYRISMVRANVEEATAKVAQCKEGIRQLMADLYTQYTIDDFIRTRFGFLEQLIDYLTKLLDQTEAC